MFWKKLSSKATLVRNGFWQKFPNTFSKGQQKWYFNTWQKISTLFLAIKNVYHIVRVDKNPIYGRRRLNPASCADCITDTIVFVVILKQEVSILLLRSRMALTEWKSRKSSDNWISRVITVHCYRAANVRFLLSGRRRGQGASTDRSTRLRFKLTKQYPVFGPLFKVYH